MVGLEVIVVVDFCFDLNEFVEGVKVVYWMIVEVFVVGDWDCLLGFLVFVVFYCYEWVINDWESWGEIVKLEIDCIKFVDIIEVEYRLGMVWVKVCFEVEIVMEMLDKDGNCVFGDFVNLVKIVEYWMFECKIMSLDFNWELFSVLVV